MHERQHHQGELGDVLHGLLVRLRIRSHAERTDSTFWLGAFALVNGGVSTALMALGALATGAPLVFPSLALFVAILLLVLQGLVINRISGIPYPIWAPGNRPVPPRG
jgi:hypothetical protein